MNSSCSPDRCDTCPGRIVCRCLQVTEDQIVSVAHRLGLRTVKEISNYTEAGSGCTCCHKAISKLLEENQPEFARV